jgi:hypothetical protein
LTSATGVHAESSAIVNAQGIADAKEKMRRGIEGIQDV